MTDKDLRIFLSGWEAILNTTQLNYRQRKVDSYYEIVPQMEEAVLHFADPALATALESEFYCHVASVVLRKRRITGIRMFQGKPLTTLEQQQSQFDEISEAFGQLSTETILGQKSRIKAFARSVRLPILELLDIHFETGKLENYSGKGWLSEMLLQTLDMCNACWDLRRASRLLENPLLTKAILWNDERWDHPDRLLLALFDLGKKAYLLEDQKLAEVFSREWAHFENDNNSNKTWHFDEFNDYKTKKRRVPKRFQNAVAIINAFDLQLINENEFEKKLEKNEAAREKKLADLYEMKEMQKQWREDPLGYLNPSIEIIGGNKLVFDTSEQLSYHEFSTAIATCILVGDFAQAISLIRHHNMPLKDFNETNYSRTRTTVRLPTLFFVHYKNQSLPDAVDLINATSHFGGHGLTIAGIDLIEEIASTIEEYIAEAGAEDAYKLAHVLFGEQLVPSDCRWILNDVRSVPEWSFGPSLSVGVRNEFVEAVKKHGNIDEKTADLRWFNESSEGEDPETGRWRSVVADWVREMENVTRKRMGLPGIGEGWISETKLYKQIESHFENLLVVQHGRPSWLSPQHLDIFIPSVNIAIEYQGRQHFEAVDFFGGEEALEKTRERDDRKRRLCAEHECELIYVLPNYSIDEVLEQIESLLNR
jgi:hypothetical protein